MVKQKSLVWRFFKLSKDELKARCGICKAILTYCKNTSNLRTHLITLHGAAEYPADGNETEDQGTSANTNRKRRIAELFDEESKRMKVNKVPKRVETKRTGPEPTATLTITEMVKQTQSFKAGAQKQRADDALLHLIAKESLPLNHSSSDAFQRYSKVLNPHYDPPKKHKVTYLMDEKFNSLHGKLKDRIKNIEEIVLTTDIWTEDKTKQSYLGLTAHYYDNKYVEIQSVILAVKPLDESHTAEYILDIFHQVLNDWSIPKAKIKLICTDKGANILKAAVDMFGADKHNPCFAHTLNLVVNDAIVDTPGVKEIIDRVKEIVHHFKSNVNASDMLKKRQKEKGVLEGDWKKLKQDVATRWNSKYDMLQRFMELSELVNPILLKLKDGPKAVEAHELERIQDLLNVLKPFKIATTWLCGEKYATLSIVIPTLYCLKKELDSINVESARGQNLKINLKMNLDAPNRFANIEKSELHSIATFLDPRQKKVHFQSAVNAANLITKVANLMRSIDLESPEEDDPHDPDDPTEEESMWKHDEDARKNANLSFVNSELGGLPLELRQYIQESVSKKKSNPFTEWESKLKTKYPRLYKLACTYLPMCATSVPSERLFSKAGIVVSEKRSRLKASRVYKLLFLGSLTAEDWGF